MNSFFSPLINKLWLDSCKREWCRFDNAAEQVESLQKKILMNSLARNAKTKYGRRFDFKNITSISQYQQIVPLTTYDDYQEEISAIAGGEQHVLTKDKVLLFEPSSGTTSPSKLIPYTSTLRQEFNCGIKTWLYNLYSNYPALKGTAYWSISPASTPPPPNSCVIPVGFAADSDYLGYVGRFITTSLQAVPAEVAKITNIESFRYVTLLFLLRHRNLCLISVWNPTFLTLLMDSLPTYWKSLSADFVAGTISPPVAIDRNLLIKLKRQFSPSPQRAEEINQYGPNNLDKLWPKLELISCWHDGPSKRYATGLQEKYFPQVRQQGKGLIATEAFVSFPLIGMQGCVLAGTSHFFEFIHQDISSKPKTKSIYLAHELKIGEIYHVVVTTGGGLYRYQLQDTVEIVGHYKELPCLRFTGKLEGISDLFGEKLNQQFVDKELHRLFQNRNLKPNFFHLCPDKDLTRYVLYLEDSTINEKISTSLASELDQNLCKNFHYAYCRKLGQLKATQVFLTGPDASHKYFSHCQAQGMGLGDIKACVLSKTPLEANIFL
jgi:hypothetical protein